MTIDPITNEIAAAATVGSNLWVAALPHVHNQGSSNYSVDVAVSASTPYRVAFTLSRTGDGNFWFFIREQNGSSADTGFSVNYGNLNTFATDGRFVHEFTTAATTTKINFVILNLDSNTRVVTLDGVSVHQVAELTPYIRLEYEDNVGGTTGPAATGGQTHVHVPVMAANLGSFIRSKHIVGTEAQLAMCLHTSETFADDYAGAAYQSKTGRLLLVGTTDFNVGNNDHILSIIRPPATAPVEVVDGAGDNDDLLGNVHGNEAIRGTFSTNAQVWYDTLGDGNWLRLANSNLTHQCKRVKVIYNTRLYDADAVDRVNSDHTVVFFAGGGVRMDRTDSFLVDTKIDLYLYWMAGFSTTSAYKGRRGHGSTVDATLDYPTSGTLAVSEGYTSSWAVLRRNSDNVCYALVSDLAHEQGQAGASGYKTRLLSDPPGQSKIYQHLEFTDPTVPATTSFTSRLWHFCYQPADTTNFHAELATLGVENAAPATPTLSAGTPSQTGVTLTGSAFSDSDVGDTHAASQWQVTTSADTTYADPIIDTGDDEDNLTSYAATELTPGTALRARVRYKDSAGNYSAWSTDATFTTAADTTPPPTPTGLTAVPGDGIVALDWDTPTDGDTYWVDVYRSTNGTDYTLNQPRTVEEGGYEDGTVVNGTSYWYRLVGRDLAGNESAPSSAVGPVVPNPPPDTDAPTLDSAVLSANGTTLTLTFSESVSDGSGSATVTVNGATAAHSAAAASGTAKVLTLTTAAKAAATVTVSLPAGYVVDGSANALVATGAVSVTNNSTVAPTLTGPAASPQSTTSASLAVTTDVGNGTLYYVVTTSATPPTAAQVVAGQNDAGTSAVASGSAAVAAAGTKTFTATGLSAVAHYAYFVHEDSGSRRSNVAASGAFTPANPATAPKGGGGHGKARHLSHLNHAFGG